MKIFLCLLVTVFIVSCSDDKNNNEALYQSYGVVKEDVNTNGKLYVESDNGKAIIPSRSGVLLNDDKGSRVWMMFSTGDNIDRDTVKVDVYELLRITQMDFKTQSDESTSDEVHLQNIWVAQDYLTLTMDVTASSRASLENHKYTMYSDKEIVNDTVRMEFKYNRNSDSRSLKFTKIVALKLDDKIIVNSDSASVVLAIKYLTNTSAREIFVTYKK
ncbi:MAG: hypothetical protein LBK97_08075 [Prevotellaceae bacterium]|jgi:hypothetical protein|nr:hypothetical protein [Prevotellaceae bacterium]